MGRDFLPRGSGNADAGSLVFFFFFRAPFRLDRLGLRGINAHSLGLIRNRDEEASCAAAAQDGGWAGVRRVPPRPAEAFH